MRIRSNTKQEHESRFELLIDDLKRRFSEHFKNSTDLSLQNLAEKTLINISIAEQQIYLLKNQKIHSNYPISSAEKGIGSHSGSNQTPLGLHQISEKIGDHAPLASIFKARKNKHTIAEILTTPNSKSTNDNITSRILWLDGLEKGINKGKDKKGNSVDSHSRYIYIHGTDEEGRLGQAASHGCIRMANLDVIELFDEVEVGCLVMITEL